MTEQNWNNESYIYLASADQWLSFEAFFNKNKVKQCENFYTVIGGMGCLNIINKLDRVKNIYFFDSNSYMYDIFQLHMYMIAISNSIDEYISNYFLRRFSFDNNKDNSFLNQRVNEEIYNNLRKKLPEQILSIYNKYYYPYISVSPSPLFGPTNHCSQLKPFHDSEHIREPMVYPFSQNINSVNAFYIGKGWLKNNEEFLNTKNILQKAQLHYAHSNAEDLIIYPKSGMYSSNIWSTDEEYSGYKRIIDKLDWLIGYDDYTENEVVYYDEKIIEPTNRFGKGDTNPHSSCCQALDTIIDLNNNMFLEVIEPHPSEGMNYGFRFYKGQNRISVQDYIQTKCVSNIIIIHILLGAGINKDLWYNICQKAYNESKLLIIVEHRKECTDFLEKEWDVHDENLISETLLDQYMYSIDYNFKKLACANLKGNDEDPRNLIYYCEH